MSILIVFLFFLPPRSQGGPAHWTSAHPQWLLHHQRAGQERCVCIWAAPKVREAEDQSGQGRGMGHPFSHMTFLLQDSTHYPRSGALFGLQHAILKQIVALPQKTMHFRQVERKVRLMPQGFGTELRSLLTAPSLPRSVPGLPCTVW